MEPAASPASSLARRLRGRKPAFSAWCGLPEPAVAGLLAREAFDAVVLDMQHGTIDFSGVARAIPLIAAGGKPAVVRVPVGDFATASRLLDAGASAIIAPMINTVEDARRLVAYTKFPPVGERSWGPHGGLALTGMPADAYFAAANGFSLVLAMVETREALAIIDDILAVPGVDGVFIGPADLSIGLSRGERLDPLGNAVDEALDRVLAAARAAGKLATVYAHTPKRAAQFAALGFSLIALGSDSGFLRSGAQGALAIAQGADLDQVG